uniref:Uncharacterized protein n=1 Tax=Streptomyces auratus AGR0001 TaxID=1160718 RepID=J2A4F9_9ACTN
MRSAPLINGTINSRGARAAGALAVTHMELAEEPRSHLMSARSSLHASLTLSPTCDIDRFRCGVVRAVRANLRQVASSPPQP